MKRPQTARWRSIHSATSRNFSYRTYPTCDRNTTTNLKASYFFFCAQNGPNITHSTQQAYAGRSVPVFPCELGAKRPLTRNGHWDATTDPRAIKRW